MFTQRYFLPLTLSHCERKAITDEKNLRWDVSHEVYTYVEYAPEDTDDAIRKVDEAQVACRNPYIEQVDDELLASRRYSAVQGIPVNSSSWWTRKGLTQDWPATSRRDRPLRPSLSMVLCLAMPSPRPSDASSEDAINIRPYEIEQRTYLQQTECDTAQDASEPELVGTLANGGRRAGLDIEKLDGVCPDERVISEVAEVAQLSADGGNLLSGVGSGTLCSPQSGLKVLHRLSEPHNCTNMS